MDITYELLLRVFPSLADAPTDVYQREEQNFAQQYPGDETDTYDFGGNDAPTQQWDVPPAERATQQVDTTKTPKHGGGRS